MKSYRLVIIFIAVAMAITAGVWLLWPDRVGETTSADAEVSSNSLLAEVTPARGAKHRGRVKATGKRNPQQPKQKSIVKASEPEFTPAEQKIVDAIQTALDDNNFQKVKAQLKTAAKSKNSAIRQKIVEALQWFGEKALSDMTPFLADEDDDVRNSAMDAIEQSLAQIEDEAAKVKYIEDVMMVKGACTEDGLTMLSGELNGISDSALSVAAAVRVIEAKTNPEAVATMKEVYEFATGEEYTTPEAAEQWFANKQAEENGEQTETGLLQSEKTSAENAPADKASTENASTENAPNGVAPANSVAN